MINLIFEILNTIYFKYFLMFENDSKFDGSPLKRRTKNSRPQRIRNKKDIIKPK